MRILASWRSWIRQLIMLMYSLMLIVAIVLISIDLDAHKADTPVWGWFVGGLFVLFSLPISIWGILQHVINYTKPELQRREIRIMWMVPIYAADAWLALRFANAAIYLDTMRECYEAYVIYNFVMYLMTYLWETHPFLERELMTQADVKLLFPLCWFPAWNGRQFLNRCKHGVLQYTVVRPITTALALICEVAGVYHEGAFKLDDAWLYLTIINSISQSWAFYCLVLFYQRMKNDLEPMKPLKKFLCIKFVIFLSFWQSVIIAIFVAAGIIKQQADWVVYDTQKIAASIQDFAICIEMFIAAIAHYFAFPHQPYVDESQPRSRSFCQSLRHMFDVDDVTEDVRDHVRVIGKVASKTLNSMGVPASYGSQSDREPLIQYSREDDSDSFNVSITYKPHQADSDSLVNFAEFSVGPESSSNLNARVDNSTNPADTISSQSQSNQSPQNFIV